MPIHPLHPLHQGKVIHEIIINGENMSVTDAAKHLGVGHTGISPEMAYEKTPYAITRATIANL